MIGEGGFVCQCPPEYTGNLCLTRVSGCSSNPCMNGAACYVSNVSVVLSNIPHLSEST